MEEKIRLHVERARELLDQGNMSFGDQRKALMHVERASQLKFGKQQCKYGIGCNRTNPSHFAQYSHPEGHRLATPSTQVFIFTALTINVSWEAMSGSSEGTAGQLGAKCSKSRDEEIGLNDCVRRVVHVCANHPHDLIFLQEVESQVDMLIVDAINKNHVADHSYIRHDEFQSRGAKVSIIHSSRLVPFVKLSSYIHTEDRRGRPRRGPIVAALFLSVDGNFSLAVLNVHAPHHILREDLQLQLLQVLGELCDKAQIKTINHVIIAGDFNQEMQDFKVDKADKRDSLKFEVMNKTCKTGWDNAGLGEREIRKGEVRGLRYKAVVDNILGANVELQHVESWCSPRLLYLPEKSDYKRDTALPKLTSDHAPVVAEFSITQPIRKKK